MTIVALEQVDLILGGSPVLRDVSWRVDPGERWAVLGPNGAGKTSLLRIVSGYAHPSRGSAVVLGERLGRTDVRELRQRIGLVSSAVDKMFRPDVTALDAVVTADHAAVLPARWFEITDDDWDRARGLLKQLGVDHLAERALGDVSSGERQRVMIARSLQPDPDLMIFDEPVAGLDLAGRESVLAALGELAGSDGAVPLLLVSHHVEEIPVGFTHALLLRDGRVVASGPLDDILTDQPLSECYGMPLTVERRDGRVYARVR